MTTTKALLWLDWRMVRRDFLLLIAVACVATPLLALSRTPGVVLAALAFSLPMVCSLLGATLVSDPRGLAFLNARAVSWNLATSLRLALRCLLAGVIVFASLVVALVATPDSPALAAWIAEGPSGWFGAAFAVIGFTCSGAALGALVRQPAAAALGGWLIYLMAGMSGSGFASWLLHQWLDLSLRKSSMWVLLAPLTVGPALLAAVAAFLLLRERKSAEPRVPWRALAKFGLVLVGVSALLVLPLYGRTAWELHRLQSALKTSALAVEVKPALVAADPAEVAEWVKQRELWHGQPRQDRLSEIGWPLTELRSSVAVDRIAELPLDVLRGILEPVNDDLDLIATSILDPSLSDGELLTVSSQLEGFDFGGAQLNAALLSRARLLQEDGRTDEARRAFAATWRLHDVLRQSAMDDYYRRKLRRALDLQLLAVLDSTPTPPELPSKLAGLDLRQGVIRAALRRYPAAGFIRGFTPRVKAQRTVWENATAERERFHGLEQALTLDPCDFTTRDIAELPARWRDEFAATLQDVRRLHLLAELTARVLEHRQGLALDTSSRCPDARWVETRQADGSWSLHLENGPIDLRHTEPAPSDIQRE